MAARGLTAGRGRRLPVARRPVLSRHRAARRGRQRARAGAHRPDGRGPSPGAHQGAGPVVLRETLPAGRGTYLEWLASGRQQPTAPGNVLLFLSGLERRVLVDLRREGTQEEYAAIAAELARLRHSHAQHAAVERHASGLLTVVSTLAAMSADSLDPPNPADVAPAELPPALRVGVARFIAAGAPVPGDWAYSWHSHHPERGWRAPATRCPMSSRACSGCASGRRSPGRA
ncbi:TerB N-terminal domain-containing protein [Luedemannella flava]